MICQIQFDALKMISGYMRDSVQKRTQCLRLKFDNCEYLVAPR